MEFCTRDLFLLYRLWINILFAGDEKITQYCTEKNDQKCGAAVIGSFTTTMPLPTRHWVWKRFWQKTSWRLSLILPIHMICTMWLFLCLIRNTRRKGNILLMSAKWKRKRWGSWTTSALKSSRNVFSSGKNVGTGVSSQNENTLKKTRVVLLWNLLNNFKKIIQVIFGSPLVCCLRFGLYTTCYSNNTTIKSSSNHILHTVVLPWVWKTRGIKGGWQQTVLVIVCLFFL